MQIYTTYSVKIKHYNHIFKETKKGIIKSTAMHLLSIVRLEDDNKILVLQTDRKWHTKTKRP